MIPGPYRDSSGWYEEDAERSIVIRYFTDEWAADGADVSTLRDDAEQSIRDHFPSRWEQVNGRELLPGESVNKDRQVWTEQHRGAFVSRAAWAAESDPDLMLVTAHRASDGVEAQYLVPRAEYREALQAGERGSDHRMAIDPARHPMLPPLDATAGSAPAPTLYKPVIPSGSALSQMYIDGDITATSRDRIARDLARRWRQEDGAVLSLQELVETQGVTARSAHQEGTAIKYRLIQPSPSGGQYVLQVFDRVRGLGEWGEHPQLPAPAARLTIWFWAYLPSIVAPTNAFDAA